MAQLCGIGALKGPLRGAKKFEGLCKGDRQLPPILGDVLLLVNSSVRTNRCAETDLLAGGSCKDWLPAFRGQTARPPSRGGDKSPVDRQARPQACGEMATLPDCEFAGSRGARTCNGWLLACGATAWFPICGDDAVRLDKRAFCGGLLA